MDNTVIANDWAIFGVLNFVTRRRSQDNQSKLFWKLFNYISGNNQNNQKIEMTVPVNTKMQVLEVGLGKKHELYNSFILF